MEEDTELVREATVEEVGRVVIFSMMRFPFPFPSVRRRR